MMQPKQPINNRIADRDITDLKYTGEVINWCSKQD